MRRVPIFFTALVLSTGATWAAGETVEINAITPEGIGKALGSVTLTEAEGGVSLKVSLSSVTDGEHGFHVHEKGDCGPGTKDGKAQAGLAAGGHFDP